MAAFTFRSAHWSEDLLDEWFDLWSELWALGVKWEWQQGDCLSYSDDRRIFRVGRYIALTYDSKGMLRPKIPLPSWSVIQDMAEWIHDKDRALYKRVYDFSQNLVPSNEVY
jgi:hypothetical protein